MSVFEPENVQNAIQFRNMPRYLKVSAISDFSMETMFADANRKNVKNVPVQKRLQALLFYKYFPDNQDKILET